MFLLINLSHDCFSRHWYLNAIIMWYAALIRFIRRRLVLGIIFASSLTYCIVSFMRESNHRHVVYQDISIESKPFVWRTLQEHNDSNESISCRNSVQGKHLLVDDRGYVCRRMDKLKSGCCDTEADFTERYSCETCSKTHCCTSYEYCVSCCLDPNKRDLLELVLSKLSTEKQVLYRTLSDDYELCLTKCRTSSQSVLHENSYKNPALTLYLALYLYGNIDLKKILRLLTMCCDIFFCTI